MVVAPWGVSGAQLGEEWMADHEVLGWALRYTADTFARGIGGLHGQYTCILGPVPDGWGNTVAVGLGRDGVLEASAGLKPGEPSRDRIVGAIGHFVGAAVAAYWRHQYYGRLLIQARLADGDARREVTRYEALPPPKDLPGWEDAALHEDVKTWAETLMREIAEDLARGAKQDRFLGDEAE